MSRVDQIAAMREMEMSDDAIAKDLGITLSEVNGGPPVYPAEPVKEPKKKTTGGTGTSRSRKSANPTGTWTRESIIAALQRWAREHGGVPPRAKDWRVPSKEYPHTASVTSGVYFDSWADAVEAAGFPRPSIGIYQGRTSWTKEKVMDAIQTWAKAHNGEAPSYSDWKLGGGKSYPSPATVTRYYGSWANGIEAAGFPRPKVGAHRVATPEVPAPPPPAPTAARTTAAKTESVRTLPDPGRHVLAEEDVVVLKEAGLDELADTAQQLLDESKSKSKIHWPWKKK